MKGSSASIVAGLVLSGAVVLAQAPRVATTRTLSGRVIAEDTGEPLPNARIIAKGTSTWTRADVSGRFTLSAPVAAALLIVKAGYLDIERTVDAGPQNGAAAVNVRMTRAAAISGRVIDEHGDPAVSLSVELIPKDNPGGHRPIAITDDRGVYRFGGVRQGTYTVSVTTDTGIITVREVGPGLFGQSPTLVKVYYGDTRVESDAAPIAVAPGDERSGVDLHVPAPRAALTLDTSVAVTAPGDSIQTLQRKAMLRRAWGIPPDTALAGNAAISGRVIATDGRPLPFAGLALHAADATAAFRVGSADENGSYEFTGLTPGRYRVTAAKPGYSLAANGYDDPGLTPTGARVEVGDDGRRDRVDVTLRPWGAISGRIVDDAGEPVPNAQVGLLVTRYEGGRRRMIGSSVGTRTTNDRGEYRIPAVPDGQYLLSASNVGVFSDVPASAVTFYPGTVNGAEASFIGVAAGDDIVGIDLALGPTPSATLSGLLVDSAGQPTTGGRFTLVGRGALASRINARIGQDGKFEFRNVPPGQYVIQADRGRLSGTREGEFAALAVTVGTADIPGLRLQTSAGSRIAGHVTFISGGGLAGGAVPGFGSVEIAPIPADFDLAPSSLATTAAGTDGAFELTGINGARRLQLTRVPPGWTLQAIMSGGRNVTDELLPFGRVDQSLDDVEVILSDRANELRGRVTNDRAQPVAGARVVVFSTRRDRWYHASRFVQSAVTTTDGSFSLTGLPTGSYFASAVPRVPPGEGSWYDPTFLDSIQSAATAITLGEGQQQALNLRIAR